MTLGAQIKKKRQELGLTLKGVAQQVGVTENAIWSLEAGRSKNVKPWNRAKVQAFLDNGQAATPAVGGEEDAEVARKKQRAAKAKRAYRAKQAQRRSKSGRVRSAKVHPLGKAIAAHAAQLPPSLIDFAIQHELSYVLTMKLHLAAQAAAAENWELLDQALSQ